MEVGQGDIRGSHLEAAKLTGEWTTKVANKIKEALAADPEKQPALLAEAQEMQHSRENAEKLAELAKETDDKQTNENS